MDEVHISDLIKEYKLINYLPEMDLSQKSIKHPEINRPGLQMAGFFKHFDSDRLQIVGLVEHSYLETMEEEERKERLKEIFDYDMPCIVLTRKIEPYPEMLKLGAEKNVPILGYENATTEFMGEVIKWLKVQLAPQITLHGVLIDIYGEGVLIMGESGVGKSEAALELIKRGHRLVADDAVEVKKVSSQTLIGTCPELIKYFIELRGIGIIDVKQMFGVESVKATQNIDLVIKLENWDDKKEYDRLGLTESHIDILGNKILCHTIPVRPGRNLAVILESAAVNHRQKRMGYNAAKVLNDRVIENINK